MRLSWLLRCNFYFCLCHKLALWPWANHHISLTHMNISGKGYCKALISADDYYMHKSSSSFSSLFSSLAISLSFQRWSRKLSGNTQNRYCFRGKNRDYICYAPRFCQTRVPSRSLWIYNAPLQPSDVGGPESAEDAAHCAHHNIGPHKIRKRLKKKKGYCKALISAEGFKTPATARRAQLR